MDAETRLRAVIAEVNNTYGDRHSYVCCHDSFRPIERNDRITTTKVFHVSPFQPVEGTYTFRFDVGPQKIGVIINYETDKGGVMATFHGCRQKMTNASILASTIRRPFGSLRVLILIYWQALKLKFKGLIYHPRPDPPSNEVSS